MKFSFENYAYAFHGVNWVEFVFPSFILAFGCVSIIVLLLLFWIIWELA